MANLQVKGINPQIYTSLKALAKKEHRSISQEVVKMIEYYLNLSSTDFENKTEDFLKLSGSWEDNRSCQEIMQEIYQSRTTQKRFENGIFN